MSNIVLNTLTYVGEGLINGLSHFWERSAGLAGGFRHLTNRVTQSASLIHVAWKLTMPELVADDSPCGCEGAQAFAPTIVDITVRFDKKAPQAHRDAVQTSLENLVVTTQFRNSVKLLTPAT